MMEDDIVWRLKAERSIHVSGLEFMREVSKDMLDAAAEIIRLRAMCDELMELDALRAEVARLEAERPVLVAAGSAFGSTREMGYDLVPADFVGMYQGGYYDLKMADACLAALKEAEALAASEAADAELLWASGAKEQILMEASDE